MRATRDWVSGAIARLIRSGLGDGASACPVEQWPLVEAVLTRLLERQPSTATGESGDALNEAINTAKGTCIETLIAYAMRKARVAGESEVARQGVWESVQALFDRELDGCRGGNYEF